jgi:hypothetical protein
MTNKNQQNTQIVKVNFIISEGSTSKRAKVLLDESTTKAVDNTNCSMTNDYPVDARD